MCGQFRPYEKILLRYFLISFFLLIQLNSFSQGTIPYGNSYVNISKKAIGGIIDKSDTLEIRNTYYFPTGLQSYLQSQVPPAFIF